MKEDDREEYDVAVVVFCRTRGIDQRDAGSGAMIALQQTLHGMGNVISGIAAHGRHHAVVADIMEVGMAAGNGYLWTQSTSKAFREYRMEELPPDELSGR